MSLLTLSEKQTRDLWPALFNMLNTGLGAINFGLFFYGFYLVFSAQLSAWYLLVGFVFYYWFGLFGLTIGLHRYFCHRSFKTNKFWHYVFAITGTLTSVGTVVAWVGLHRHHHLNTDTENDAHDPRRNGILKTWFYIYKRVVISDKYVRPELKDPLLIILHKFYFPIIFTYIAALLGIAMWMGLANPLALVIWCYAVPACGVYVGLSAVTTIAHLHGYKTYESKDEARNSWLASLLSGGEGWHNNHHVFPSHYRQGHQKWELDPAAWMIEHFIGKDVRRIDYSTKKKISA
ncbi:MAG: fatty acid desaturase [Hydrotalea sp.]|nr:fatty acid desaturase [Hydrotalea sp.]